MNEIKTEKHKNITILIAKEPVISTILLLLEKAWCIPIAVSTWKTRVLIALSNCKLFVWLIFPVTAACGDTFDAFFAGEPEAIITTNNPRIMPAAIPGRLT